MLKAIFFAIFDVNEGLHLQPLLYVYPADNL